jgi:hypothetical protein
MLHCNDLICNGQSTIFFSFRSCQNVDFLPDLIQKYKDDGTLVELNDDLNRRMETIKSVLK